MTTRQPLRNDRLGVQTRTDDRARVESIVPETGTTSAARVADVLLIFLSSPGPLGVSDIANQLGFSKAVVHRILQSLASRMLISPTVEGRQYELGPMAHAIGARSMQTSNLWTVAMPVLRSMARDTQETVTVSQLLGDRRVYVGQIPSFHEIRMTVELGRPFPLHAGSSSRAILAFCDQELQMEILRSDLESMTPATLTSARLLSRALQQVRRHGVAISQGERQSGAGSVAAPIFDRWGRVVGSLSVCGPSSRLSQDALERFAPLVRHSAREVSHRLGSPVEQPPADVLPAAQELPRRSA